MKSRGLCFNERMVKAILDGKKTRTTRPIKPQPDARDEFIGWCIASGSKEGDADVGMAFWGVNDGPHSITKTRVRCRLGEVGNRIWVREKWAHDARDVETARKAHEDAMIGPTYGPYYFASESKISRLTLNWLESKQMPRWASRITLEITSRKVCRLNDVTETEAIEDGFESIEDYQCEMQGIYGKEFCDSNPWLWSIGFKVVNELVECQRRMQEMAPTDWTTLEDIDSFIEQMRS